MENQNNSELVSVEHVPVEQVVQEVVAETEAKLDTPQETSEDNKYTKIDNLDEDEPINGQKWVLMSFISPEGVMNCTVRGVKVRGVYATEEAARNAAAKFKKTDKYFDVFVGEVGKWLPWDPNPMDIGEAVYNKKKQTQIMENVHKKNLSTMNELVGRKKEIIDEGKNTHKNRVSQSVKESLNKSTAAESTASAESASATTQATTSDTQPTAMQATATQATTTQATATQPKPKNNHNPQQMRERLQKLRAEKEAAAASINSLETKSGEVSNNLTQLKELYANMKKNVNQ